MSESAGRSSPAVLPFGEIFSLDLRSLALFRLGLATMLLLDWIDRLPDLRVLYSDSGILPRSIISGMHPVSLHMLHGSVWFQVVLAGIACVFALLLFVGYRTVFVTLVSWLLLISVHTRMPAVMQGGDQLMRMLLFWSIFLPLGACYSLDAARPGARPPSARVLSLASVAYILQLCQVYWYAAGWKWMAPWREEGTAIYLALHVDYFPTRLGLWLREQPALCRLLTHYTIWLETLGPMLLLLPFHIGLQRMVSIIAFITFHAGLALTMELGHFPFVCMVAWLPILPASFWDRLQPRLRQPGVAGLTLLYDPDRPRAASAAASLRTFLLLGESRLVSASGPDLLARLRSQGGWAVVDAAGREWVHLDAVALLVRHSPLFAPLERTLRWPVVHPLVGWLLDHSGGRAAAPGHPAASPGTPRWQPPTGLVANTVLLFCMVYVMLFNAASYASQKIRALHPDLAARWLPLVPDQFGQFGALGLEQGWGLFAPEPGRYAGWFLIVGVRADGTRIDLLRAGEPVSWERPEFQTATYWNGRWRKLMMNLSAPAAYPYLLPGFTRYYFHEWNRRHAADAAIEAVEVYWMRERTVPPGEEPTPVEKVFLGSYQATEPRPGETPGWLLVVGTRQDGSRIDLLRGGMQVDWDNPDLEAARQVGSPWQPLLLTLIARDAATYMLPGFARYQLEEWNRQHQGNDRVHHAEVVWVKGEALLPGKAIAPADRKVLGSYAREAGAK